MSQCDITNWLEGIECQLKKIPSGQTSGNEELVEENSN